MSRQEDRRQLVHLAMTGWVLILPWLTQDGARALAGAAVLLNWVVLPLSGLDRRWFRREDGPFVDGAKLYPVAVLVALLLLPVPAAAAAWAILGVGDACSNLLGRRFGRPPLLGRADRSLAGTAAFMILGFPAAAGAYLWCARTHGGAETPDALLATAAATVAGALAELVPWPRGVDDNLPITLAAVAVLAALL